MAKKDKKTEHFEELINQIEDQYPSWDKWGNTILIKDFNSNEKIKLSTIKLLCDSINKATKNDRIYNINSYKDVAKKHNFSKDKSHSFFVDLTSSGWKYEGVNNDVTMSKVFFSISRSKHRTLFVFINKETESFFQRAAEVNCDVEITFNLAGIPQLTYSNYCNSFNEKRLKRNYLSSREVLWRYLHDKYSIFNDKPIQIKKNAFPNFKGTRIGFYEGFDLPTFMYHARIHTCSFGKEKYVLCDDEFEIYKEKTKNKQGKTVHFVDVKCPDCNHIGVYDMRFLVWKLNCEKCKSTITTEDRVKKTKFKESDFR